MLNKICAREPWREIKSSKCLLLFRSCVRLFFYFVSLFVFLDKDLSPKTLLLSVVLVSQFSHKTLFPAGHRDIDKKVFLQSVQTPAVQHVIKVISH